MCVWIKPSLLVFVANKRSTTKLKNNDLSCYIFFINLLVLFRQSIKHQKISPVVLVQLISRLKITITVGRFLNFLNEKKSPIKTAVLCLDHRMMNRGNQKMAGSVAMIIRTGTDLIIIKTTNLVIVRKSSQITNDRMITPIGNTKTT